MGSYLNKLISYAEAIGKVDDANQLKDLHNHEDWYLEHKYIYNYYRLIYEIKGLFRKEEEFYIIINHLHYANILDQDFRFRKLGSDIYDFIGLFRVIYENNLLVNLPKRKLFDRFILGFNIDIPTINLGKRLYEKHKNATVFYGDLLLGAMPKLQIPS